MTRREWLLALLATAMIAPRHAYPANARTREDRGELLRPCQTRPGRLHLPYRHFHRGVPGRPTAVFLGGGPGVSNLDFTPPDAWLDVVDVLVPEYRGVGQSQPVLHTDHFTRALNRPMSRLDLDGARIMQADLARGFEDLLEQGVVLAEFGPAALADDIEALRRHLHLPPLLLVAHSFGTRIAQAVQTRHPAAVRGSLLLSNNTPGGLFWYPQDTQSVWRRWCSSVEARDSGLARPIGELLERGWDRQGQWQTNDSRALMLCFFMSFNTGTRLKALKTLLAAQRGSSALWWAMGKSFPLFTRFSFNWADFFVKGHVTDADPDALARCDREGAHALFQSPSAVLFSGTAAFHALGGRRDVLTPPDYRNTLLVTGEFDPSTPIERWPRHVPARQQIILPGAGHVEALSAALNHGHVWLQALLDAPQPQVPAS